uniref:Uncharacterized protein n=1 Tax=Aegilops tauschii subsp. strangulata TaxID=200361 RepID=A0A452XFF7_AEGTS
SLIYGRTGRLWLRSPAISGCVLCRKRADLLAAKQEAMEAAGVSLVLIGPGTVEQAKAFSDQTKFKGEVYADPDYSSYKALEFANGLFSTFTPSVSPAG